MAVAVADRQIDINQTAGRESAGEDRFFHENGFLAGSCRLDCGGNACDTAADNGNIIIDFEIHSCSFFMPETLFRARLVLFCCFSD